MYFNIETKQNKKHKVAKVSQRMLYAWPLQLQISKCSGTKNLG